MLQGANESLLRNMAWCKKPLKARANHLDLGSFEWLEEFLKNHKGTALVISHDRYFLDRVVSGVVEIEEGKAQQYEGNYSFFIREKRARQEQQLAKYKQEQSEIKRLGDLAEQYCSGLA